MQWVVPAGTPEILRNILEQERLAVDVNRCPPLSAGQASDALGGHTVMLQHLRVQFSPQKGGLHFKSKDPRGK